VNGHSQSFNVVASVCSSREVGQVELDLVPALVQPHGHRTDKGLDPGSGLVVGSSESPSHVFVVQDLHFEGEVFF